MPGTDLERDESIRPGSTVEKLAALKPVFRADGTVTAGNSSPLNDGASAVLIGSAEGARKAGREPLARIASSAVSGVDPDVFGIGPVEAANVALRRAGIGWGDLAQVELNEAFAAQSLACLAAWPDLDPRDRQPARWRHRDRAPPRGVGRSRARPPRPQPARPRWRLGPGGPVHRRRARASPSSSKPDRKAASRRWVPRNRSRGGMWGRDTYGRPPPAARVAPTITQRRGV